jgi:hypothetical protein
VGQIASDAISGPRALTGRGWPDGELILSALRQKEGKLPPCGSWREVKEVAKNTGKGYREGAVRDRSQLETPAGWTKRDSETGRFMDVKSDGEPFKGVRREHPDSADEK